MREVLMMVWSPSKIGCSMLKDALFDQEDLKLYQIESLCPRSREEKYKNIKVWAGK